MTLSNFERMLQLIDEVFDTRNDPGQLQVNEAVLAKLPKLHPATLSQYDEGKGPAVWILIFPTTKQLMEDFLAHKISEQQLLDETKEGMPFEALYLCSATTLPEYRRKGITKKLGLEAISAIRKDFPAIRTLFTWPFTKEGNALADKIEKETGMELRKRVDAAD